MQYSTRFVVVAATTSSYLSSSISSFIPTAAVTKKRTVANRSRRSYHTPKSTTIPFFGKNTGFRLSQHQQTRSVSSTLGVTITTSSSAVAMDERTENGGNEITTIPPVVPIGGDFSGISATYDPTSGKFIPIPEYIIPSVLLEWGQQPSTLEILVSEDEYNSNNPNLEWTRYVTTLMPEVGCAIDNIESKKTIENIETSNIWHHTLNQKEENRNILVQQSLNYLNKNTILLETIFGWIEPSHRVRITLKIDFSNTNDVQLVKPVTINYERQINTTSSKGTVADGGGLDGRSVSVWIGPLLKKYANFPLDNNVPTTNLNSAADENTNIIQFPGTNVTLSSFVDTTTNTFTIDIGQIFETKVPSKDDRNQQTDSSNLNDNILSRHVVRRIFKSPVDIEVVSFITPIIIKNNTIDN